MAISRTRAALATARIIKGMQVLYILHNPRQPRLPLNPETDYRVNPDGSVDLLRQWVDLDWPSDDRLPFEIKSATSMVIRGGGHMTHWQGLPGILEGRLAISDAPRLTSWQGCPGAVSALLAEGCGFTDLRGVPRCSEDDVAKVEGCPLTSLAGLETWNNQRTVLLGWNPELPLLRTLALRPDCGLRLTTPHLHQSPPECLEAQRILRKWRHEYHTKSRNMSIMKCQAELVAAGLGGVAKW